MTTQQPRWPRGTPVAPSGHGPGGGRFRDASGWAAAIAAGLPTPHLPRLGLSRVELEKLRDEHDSLAYVDYDAAPEQMATAGQLEEMAKTGRLQIRYEGDTTWQDIPSDGGVVYHALGEVVIYPKGSNRGRILGTDTRVWTRIGSTGGYRETRFSNGAIAYTRGRTYEDGRRVVVKVEAPEAANDEYLASLVGEAIGAPTPQTALGDQPGVLWMGWADGMSGLDWADQQGWGDDVKYENLGDWETEWADQEPGWRLGLLDLLVDNHDRHPGNWMLAEGEDPDNPDFDLVTGLDHNVAWYWQAPVHDNPPGWLNDLPATKAIIKNNGTRWNTDRLTLDEADEIDRRLRALEPEFARLYRQTNYQYTIQAWESYYRAIRRDKLARSIPVGELTDPHSSGLWLQLATERWDQVGYARPHTDAVGQEWIEVYDPAGGRMATIKADRHVLVSPG